ncbi:MAG: PIN domain-containing protein [Syntrophomonadaceae bacterium]|jgi:predicted nucleic acid-binding protein|nr:PIN domain-containing protein [Syntrophomonadaceae bacterium]
MELKNGTRLFVDTAPIIYFIEEHPLYIDEVSDIFGRTAEGTLQVITSVITMIEVLTKPYKLGQNEIACAYRDFFTNSKGFSVMGINTDIAELTARIRAKLGFKLPDALQLAIFEHNNCDVFLTNDKQLKIYDKSRLYILGEND